MITPYRWLDDARAIGFRQRVAVVAGVGEQVDGPIGRLPWLTAEVARNRVSHERAQSVFVHHSSS